MNERRKAVRWLLRLFAVTAIAGVSLGHDLRNPDNPHPDYDLSVNPPHTEWVPAWLIAQTESRSAIPSQPGNRRLVPDSPGQSAAFAAFAPKVGIRWDRDFLFVESDGLPVHEMMVGITAWQQQVPLPQAYTGENAWRIPLHPVVAAHPASIKGRFLRGAIALAANGIPIFNPQNNRGEISAEIGELDRWGGHCGRADDYHYHAAPLHLQSIVGKSQPIAFALDGYPIYGLTEPDGSVPEGLDTFNGHDTGSLGYHYHASTRYPYVNGGFHGEVVEIDGQVDPQPRARPVRQALPPLRGARIVGFTRSPDQNSFTLEYTLNDRPASVSYIRSKDGIWTFRYSGVDGSTREESYRSVGQSRSGGRQALAGDRPAQSPIESKAVLIAASKTNRSFILRSSAVVDGGSLPLEYTGDGPGSTLPLEWTGAPEGTKSYAIIMDHLAPGNVMKCYWTIWDIPPEITSIPKNVRGIGKLGVSFKGSLGYEPPHSQGPGPKTYTLHVYALSAPVDVIQPTLQVTREILLGAIQDKILATADLSVVYNRTGNDTRIGH